MQPLSRRTVRFLIDIQVTDTNYRSIVRFGAGSNNDVAPYVDAMISIYIPPSLKCVLLEMAKSTLDTYIGYLCPSVVSVPSLVTVVYTPTTMSMFINTIKQRCFVQPSNVVGSNRGHRQHKESKAYLLVRNKRLHSALAAAAGLRHV